MAIWLFAACQSEKPAPSAAELEKIQQAKIADAIHGFYKWYATVAENPAMNNPFLVPNAKGDGFKFDAAMLENYLKNVQASGSVGQAWADGERAFCKLHEKSWNATLDGDQPDGLGLDRFYCGQDFEPKEFTTAPVEAVVAGKMAKATLKLAANGPNGGDRNFDLVQENGKWMISKFHCGGGETAPVEQQKGFVNMPGPVKAPKEFIVELDEKGTIKIMGGVVAFDDFEKTLLHLFTAYRESGAKKMPPIKFKLNGTVTMGTRHELETIYNDTKKKFDNRK